MRYTLKHSIAAATALAVLGMAPGNLDAQEAQPQQEQQEVCTAELSPATVAPGQSAVKVTANFSEPLGGITAIDPGSESGVAVAAPSDLPRQDMAAEGEQPRPVKMADDGTALEVWLNTETARPGTHAISFRGESSKCAGELTVEEGSGSG